VKKQRKAFTLTKKMVYTNGEDAMKSLRDVPKTSVGMMVLHAKCVIKDGIQFIRMLVDLWDRRE